MIIEEMINRENDQGVIERMIFGVDTDFETYERHRLFKADKKIVPLEYLRSLGYDISKEGEYRVDFKIFWLPEDITVDKVKEMNLFDYELSGLEPYS
jgi:hypothetical protein